MEEKPDEGASYSDGERETFGPHFYPFPIHPVPGELRLAVGAFAGVAGKAQMQGLPGIGRDRF